MRLHGIELHTADAGGLADFYAAALGGEVCAEHGGPGRLEVVLPGDGIALAVVRDGGARSGGAVCLEFRVGDVDAEYARLLRAGIAVMEPPSDLPWGFRYLTVHDPDGNGVSFVCPIEAGAQ